MLFKRISSLALLSFLTINSLVIAPLANAQGWTGCVKGPDGTVVTIGCAAVVFERILTVALYFIGIIAFVMIVFSGVQMLLAGGDPKKTEVASKTLTYSVGGIIGVFIVWFILVFIANFTGAKSILEFNLLFPT